MPEAEHGTVFPSFWLLDDIDEPVDFPPWLWYHDMLVDCTLGAKASRR